MDTSTVDVGNLLVGNLAVAATIIKFLISVAKQVRPQMKPNTLRLLSMAMGVPIGFLLKLSFIGDIGLPPILLYGNHLLAGVFVGVLGIGVHEVVKGVKS